MKTTLNEVKKLIKENNHILFIQDVISALGCSSSSFYRWFPTDSENYLSIVEELNKNKSACKKEIRDRLLNSKSAASLIFLYKMLASEEERNALKEFDKTDEGKNLEEEIKLEVK